jgi:hypothetical protein
MTDKRKITNISDARSRATANKKDNRSGASAGSPQAAYEKALFKQRGTRGLLSGSSNGVRWYHYLQLLLLLALVAWLMKSCNG